MDDETRLWQAYTDGHDPSIREDLIMRYVPLVHFVLGRLGLTPGPDYEDLVSQGMLGLIEAVDRYDPANGTRFSTYATLRIRGQIVDSLRRLDMLSRPARHRVRSVQAAISELLQQFGRPPTEEELAAHVSLELSTLRRVLVDANLVLISLDTTADVDRSLHESLPDLTPRSDPADAMSDNEEKQRLGDAIRLLAEREQLVLSLYYIEGLTMKEIGQVLGVSESRVSQLHAKAVLGLRSIMTAQMEIASTPDIPIPVGASIESLEIIP